MFEGHRSEWRIDLERRITLTVLCREITAFGLFYSNASLWGRYRFEHREWEQRDVYARQLGWDKVVLAVIRIQSRKQSIAGREVGKEWIRASSWRGQTSQKSSFKLKVRHIFYLKRGNCLSSRLINPCESGWELLWDSCDSLIEQSIDKFGWSPRYGVLRGRDKT